MKIIVGLGNPGKEYDKTRHNVGWLFLDYYANKNNEIIDKKKLDCKICETKINGEKIVLAKPLTYMNLSGIAVSKLKKWYKVENKDIIIVYDDIDIDFGTIRYKEKGSGGSHNGMKNIVEQLSTKDIPRIRIGIGGIKHPRQDLKDFVLEKFSSTELSELDKVYEVVEQKLNETFFKFITNKNTV